MDERILKSLEVYKINYIEATILIPPMWDVEFHVHIVITLTLGLQLSVDCKGP